jgi:predicted aminopeptidase
MMRRILGIALGIVIILGIWQRELLTYGWMQGKGQFLVLWNAQPLPEVLASNTLPDSLEAKLRLIETIKRFAIDSLQLSGTKNYTTFYDQHGKPILWVLTATEPYRMEAKMWDFPLVGSFTYKGFFDEQKLKLAEQALIKQGYDTETSPVSAWSTLGWFRDPVLSSMLYRSEGSLANLIIHEMTHGTLFVKDNHEFNENLAEFVGHYGAVRFLTAQYGADSPQLAKYLERRAFNERFSDHVLRGAQHLDSLYRTFRADFTSQQKDSLKYQAIRRIVQTTDSLLVGTKLSKKALFDENKLPNNAYFIGYLTYKRQQNQFEEEFRTVFKANFKQYLAYLKQKYPSI